MRKEGNNLSYAQWKAATLSGCSTFIALAAVVVAVVPSVVFADAESSNTLSATLNFSPTMDNLFGFSRSSAFDVGNKPAPNAGSVTSDPTAASVTINVPQDVVSVSPNNSDSQTTSATLVLRLANLSGGRGPLPAQSFDATLQGSLTYVLDDSLVDDPPRDEAESSYFVNVLINGALASADTFTVSSSDMKTNTVPIDIPSFLLPANSLTTVVLQLGLEAEASSSRPPFPPFPPPPPPVPPVYPTVPEPTTWALLLAGIGGIGAAARRRAKLAR